MGDSSNGKLEETQETQHQSLDEDKKVVVIEDVGDSKPVVEFIKEIDIGDDYGDDTVYANKNVAVEEDESPPDHNDLRSGSGSFEAENNNPEEGSREMVEDKEASESIALVELPIEIVDSDLKEIKEKPLEIDESSPVGDLVLEKNEGKAASKGIEETKFPHTNMSNESSSASVDAEQPKGIEETELPEIDEKNEDNTGESSGTTVAEAREQYVKSNNASEESEKPEVLEDTANPSMAYVIRQPLQPTSWRSCCGIFEVLRRSRR